MPTQPHHHSLEGNNPLRGTDYIEHASPTNQGIVNSRPKGRQPPGSSILLDTVVDQDASAEDQTDDSTAQSTFPGATSQDVHAGLGVPMQGMSSRELRHDGQHGRKRRDAGVEQFGEGEGGEMGRGHGARRVDGASERRWVVGKTEFQEDA